MGKASLWVLIGMGVLLAGVLGLQYQSNRRVAAEVATLRQELASRAVVREPAVGALRDYAADPTVQKWLRWARALQSR